MATASYNGVESNTRFLPTNPAAFAGSKVTWKIRSGASEVMGLPADVGQSLIVYGAEPGSDTEEALYLLSIWAATNKVQATSQGVSLNS